MSGSLAARVSRATWARVDSGFHVASRAGEFLGYVDRSADGSFLAFDGRSTPVGRYDTLREAQRAVLSVDALAAGKARVLSRRSRRAFQRAAAASGVVAGGLALTAGAVAPYL